MGFQLWNSRSDVRKRRQGGHTWLGGCGYTLVLVENTAYLLLCAEVREMHSAAASPRIKTQSTVQGSSETRHTWGF